VVTTTITIGAAARATAVPTVVPAKTPAPAPPVPATPAPVVQPVAPTPVPVTPAPGTPAPTARPTTAPTATPTPAPAQPAPAVTGAIGYGAATVGGAGGRTIAVTTLADSGAGSLRAALDADGPRVIVFSVGGTITLRDSLKIDSPYVTIAGETAPSPVVIRGGGTLIVTHDVVVRHLRFRPGDDVANPADVDALTINGMGGSVYNVIVDHTSMIWGPDIGGLALLGDVRNVTISNSIMGEGLYLSRHPEATAAEGGHSHAANLTQLDGGSAWPRRITMVGNLFTTADSRVPRLQGAECVDMVNNVIYNWGTRSAHGNPRSLNLVNNYYRFGPESRTTDIWDLQTSAVVPNPFGAVVYSAGNRADGFAPTQANGGSAAAGSVRCGGLSVGAASADVAYSSVLSTVGATLPIRDAVDGRIVSNVKGRTGTFFNGSGAPAPNPY
jgi:pectate lyase